MRAVAIVRRRAGGLKTGHAGTLDPLATGVLVMALGRATKSIDALMATDKRYETVIDLAGFTATDDAEGEIEPVEVATPPTLHDIEAAMAAFRGSFDQRPPNFSAIKIGGRRAYKMARQGDEVEIPARAVRVDRLEVLAYAWPRLTLDIACAKGFYVRSLARDLGTALGTGGFCRSIRRTEVGPFTLARSIPLDDVPDPLPLDALLPTADALALVAE
jgi:tRNA pseudouridine55 synthase